MTDEFYGANDSTTTNADKRATAPKARSAQRAQGAQKHRGWSARKVTTMALFVALGFILSFIEIPLMPYLKYDPANVTALLAGLAYGPVSGCLVGGVTAVLHACVTGNWPGALVNIVVACAFVLPAAIVYRHSKRVAWQVFGLVLSCIAMLACAVAMNLLVYPFLGTPVEAVVAMIVPLLIPFNIIKGVINAVLAFVLQKSLRKFLVV